MLLKVGTAMMIAVVALAAVVTVALGLSGLRGEGRRPLPRTPPRNAWPPKRRRGRRGPDSTPARSWR